MTSNNNLSPLPFYTQLSEQNHRKSYAYGEIYPLICEANRLLPFQILRQHHNAEIESFEIYRKDGSLFADVALDAMQVAGLRIIPYAGSVDRDVIAYTAIAPIALNMPDGIYYIAISDGVETWFSEMFTAVQDVSGYLKIEWYDDEDLIFDAGVIAYTDEYGRPYNYRNRLFLCTELGRPEYQFEEEGEDRDGYYFPEKQISEKIYRAQVLAPEYLCDVMRFIRMADHVAIADKYGRNYVVDTFLMTPTWLDQGDLASVEMEFQTDTVVKKIGGFGNMNIPLAGITITGATTIANGVSQALYDVVYAPSDTTEQGVTWSVVSGSDLATIAPNGTLNVTATTSGTVTIRATSLYNAAIYGELTVNIVRDTTVFVTGLTINGATTIGANVSTAQYSVAYTPSGTTQRGVTWSVVSGSEYGSINSTLGLLTVTTTAPATMTIRATSIHNFSVFAEKTITIEREQETTEDFFDTVTIERGWWEAPDFIADDGTYEAKRGRYVSWRPLKAIMNDYRIEIMGGYAAQFVFGFGSTFASTVTDILTGTIQLSDIDSNYQYFSMNICHENPDSGAITNDDIAHINQIVKFYKRN